MRETTEFAIFVVTVVTESAEKIVYPIFNDDALVRILLIISSLLLSSRRRLELIIDTDVILTADCKIPFAAAIAEINAV